MLLAARGPWLLSSLLTLALARGAPAAPTPAPVRREASGPLEPGGAVQAPAADAPAEDPLVRVGALINDGQTLFDTADYAGAIDRWTQAYALLPDAPDIAATRNLLAYQIAQAYIEADAVDPQPSHLRKAERLLTQYIEGLDPAEVESRTAAEQTRADLRARLLTLEPPPTAVKPAPAPEPAPAPTPVPTDSKRRSPLTLIGGISLGLGGALLIGTAVAAAYGANVDKDGEDAVAHGAGAAELDALLARGTKANTAAIATAIAGSVLVATGLALVITGRVRKRPVAAAPALAPGFVGVALRARF